MNQTTPLPVESPPPPAPMTVAPKMDQEALNIEAYARVYVKCLSAAGRVAFETNLERSDDNKIKIASAIFDRFYNDQSTMRQGALQAKAMIEGMQSVIGGRR